MSLTLKKLERALRRTFRTKRPATSIEASTALIKAALELAIFAALLYLTGEMVSVIWRLANNFAGALIPPS